MGYVGMQEKRTTVQQYVCVVPYRAIQTSLELCLVTGEQDHHWEFPKILAREDVLHRELALEAAQLIAGVVGELHMEEPLHEFHFSRGVESRLVVAYLMRVRGDVDGWESLPKKRRRRWCFPEEARVRIRRKPLRHLIDLATRQAGGNGNSGGGWPG